MEKELTKEEKLSYILKNELLITTAISQGHKASIGDEYHEIRKKLKQYRLELGLIKK